MPKSNKIKAMDAKKILLCLVMYVVEAALKNT
jgi:hypothetical protein